MAVSTIDPNGLNIGQIGGTRNLIINGAMQVAQRGTSAVTVDGGGIYTLDRWRAYDTTDGVFTVQQVADAPAGFINSAKATVTTADASLSTNQQAKFQQRIEGYNSASLALGTSGAKSFTLSFWVKSSETGTYAVGFINANNDRSFVSTYTINSANTWEYKTLSVSGDTTGTWRVDNVTGLNIQWSLGMGPNYEGTVGAWQSGEYSHASGAVNLLSTLNATWQITGVQLEVGDTATPFEHRSYGQELALCQRYYYEITSTNGTGYFLGDAFPASGSEIATTHKLPTTMRAEPSVVVTNQTSIQYRSYNNNVAITGSSYSTEPGKEGKSIWFTSQSGVSSSSGGYIRTNANATSSPPRIIFDAEL